jgi:hypothetical protein
MWDPTPFYLRMFCLFSPLHIIIYWFFLPVDSMDNRPSVTVVKTLLLQVLVSAHLYLLEWSFLGKEKDDKVIQKEVMNEYDTKFVYPMMNTPVRNVATQITTSTSAGTSTEPQTPGQGDAPEIIIEDEDVVTGTPTTVINRGWKINPNPSYARHIAPDNEDDIPHREVLVPNPKMPLFATPAQQRAPSFIPSASKSMRPLAFTPPTQTAPQPHAARDSSPLRHSLQPGYTSTATGTSTSVSRHSTGPTPTGDGGYLGVQTHSASPLKKATSLYDINQNRGTPRNGREAARREIAEGRERERERERQRLTELERVRVRESSPVKRMREAERREENRRISAPAPQQRRDYY